MTTSLISPRFDVTSLGEIMLRLSVPEGYRLEDTEQFDLRPAGAESNLCVAMACLGRRAGWVSRLPNSSLGYLVLRRLRGANIDLSAVVLADQARIGTYFVEYSVPPRPIQVIYDRANSAISQMTPKEVDWDYLLDTRLLHLTGITPALSGSCHEIIVQAIQQAKAANIAISFDINYRSLLWSPQKAATVLKPLIQDVELLFCGQGDAKTVFGFTGDEKQILHDLQKISQAHYVIMSKGNEGAFMFDGDKIWHEPALPTQMIDRLGAGDALATGVLDGWLDQSLREGLRRGTALAAMALSQMGDMLNTNRAEMEAILAQHDGGVRR